MALRCLIVDDNESFLEEASALLKREGLDVVGVASTTREALERTEAVKPDVALIDISLGTESGFDLARRLARLADGRPKVILVSTHSESDFAELIEEAPVAGFVAKSALSAAAVRRLVDAA